MQSNELVTLPLTCTAIRELELSIMQSFKLKCMLLVRGGAVPEGLAGNELNCIPTVWGKVVSTMVSIFLVYPKRVFTKACLNV